MTLALKPTVVLPPGGLTNQAAQSERERANRGGWGVTGGREEREGSNGCHGYSQRDVSTLVYLWAAGACTAAVSLRLSRCVRVVWMQVNACTQTHRGVVHRDHPTAFFVNTHKYTSSQQKPSSPA